MGWVGGSDGGLKRWCSLSRCALEAGAGWDLGVIIWLLVEGNGKSDWIVHAVGARSGDAES